MIIDEQEKRRRYLLRVAGAQEEKLYIGPERVYLPITNRCNLCCRYCFFHSPGNPAHSRLPADMPFDKFQEVVRDCVDLKVDGLYVSGEGEPTLHPRFSEMMDFLCKQPLATVVFTNGTFSVERYEDIIKADGVIINLGAINREDYRLLHGEDYFDHVIENIRRLVRFRDFGKRPFRIDVDYVINKMNFHQRHEAEAIFKEMRLDSFIPTIMSEHDGNQELRAEDIETSSIETGKPSALCFNGWFFAIATFDGQVCFCFQRPQWEIASMEKMSFREVWLSREFMDARRDGKCGRLGARFRECQKCLHSGYNMKLGKKFFKESFRLIETSFMKFISQELSA